jgi:hypothetical protein
MTSNHDEGAYLVDAPIKGKGERKFFDEEPPSRVASRFSSAASAGRRALPSAGERGIHRDPGQSITILSGSGPPVLWEARCKATLNAAQGAASKRSPSVLAKVGAYDRTAQQ